MAAPFGPGLAPLLGVSDDGFPRGYPGAPMLLALVEALLARGHRLTLVSTDEGLFERGEGPQRFGDGDLSAWFCPRRPRGYRSNRGLPGRIMDLFAFERGHIAKIIAETPADIVHAHWTYEFALAAIATGMPTLVTAHDAAWKVLSYAPSPYRFGRLLMQRQALKRASWLSAVSPILKNDLESAAAAPIHVIANPLADRFFTPSSPDPERGQFCMVLNDWTRWKNPKPVLRAWTIVRAQQPAAVLHCYGGPFGVDGPVAEWANRNQLADGIRFHGAKPYEEVAGAMIRCEALINPSRYETFGMVVAEAMALGVPVFVGTESGALRWLADDGVCGGLVDMRDPQAIAALVLRQMEGGAVTGDMARVARDRIRAIASAGTVAEAYESLYTRIAACAAPEPA